MIQYVISDVCVCVLIIYFKVVRRNLCDEDCFILSAVKDETSGSFRLLLRSPLHNNSSLFTQTTPISHSGRTTLNVSLDQSS